MSIWHNRLSGSEEAGGPAYVSVTVQKATGAVLDIADDVMAEPGGVTVHAAGRQTELARTEPGGMDLTINNMSGDFTPGRAAAPVMLQQGMPVQVKETVGRRSFNHFDGTMAQPESLMNGLPNGAGDLVSVTAVDWPGAQQDNARAFISNLGEFILDAGGDTLAEYWPMTETARPFLPVKSASSPAITSRVFTSSTEPNDSDARIAAAAGAMPLGEDSRIPVIGGPLLSTGGTAFSYHLGVDWQAPDVIATAPAIPSGQVCTTVAWCDPVEFADNQGMLEVTLLDWPSGVASLLTAQKAVAGPVTLDAFGGAMTGSVTGASPNFGRPFPMAIRHGINPSVFELWLGRKRFVGSLSGAPPASHKWVQVDSGAFNSQGSFGHIQLYIGPAEAFTFEDYLAQIDHAESPLTGGLRWQRTDERIATVSRYAGLSDSQLQLDRGTAYMPRASLAGKTWTQVAQEAVDTEQGRLLWRDQHLEFHNRVTTKYNL